MKRLFLGLFLFGVIGLSFSLEIQIPLYFVHANNFLSGTLRGTYNDKTVLEMEHNENISGMGGGTGADFYFNRRHWFGDGIYFRFNYYNPYHINSSDVKIKTIVGSLSYGNSERDITDSFSLDFSVGGIWRFKYKKFEFPLVFALTAPRVSKINLNSNALGKESVADFGILFDISARYFFVDKFFATIGGRYGIGVAVGSFPDANLTSSADLADIFFPSQIVAGYIGIGIKL